MLQVVVCHLLARENFPPHRIRSTVVANEGVDVTVQPRRPPFRFSQWTRPPTLRCCCKVNGSMAFSAGWTYSVLPGVCFGRNATLRFCPMLAGSDVSVPFECKWYKR